MNQEVLGSTPANHPVNNVLFPDFCAEDPIMTDEEYQKCMDRTVRVIVEDLQVKISDEGYGKDQLFVQKACRAKAVEIIRPIIGDPECPIDLKTAQSVRAKVGLPAYSNRSLVGDAPERVKLARKTSSRK